MSPSDPATRDRTRWSSPTTAPRPSRAPRVRHPAGRNVPVSATSTKGLCTLSGQKVTCNIGTLAVGATATVDDQGNPSADARRPLRRHRHRSRAATPTRPRETAPPTATHRRQRPPDAANDTATTNTEQAGGDRRQGQRHRSRPGRHPRRDRVQPAARHGRRRRRREGHLHAERRTTPGPTPSPTPSPTAAEAPPPPLSRSPSRTPRRWRQRRGGHHPGTPVNIPVLGNDTDANGDPVQIAGFPATTPSGGTLTKNNNGTPSNPADDYLVYTPSPTFDGTETFTYTITDGRAGTTAGVGHRDRDRPQRWTGGRSTTRPRRPTSTGHRRRPRPTTTTTTATRCRSWPGA